MKKKVKPLTATEKRLLTLAIETEKNMNALLEQLTKNPVIQVACQRVGIGRSTYYEWRETNKVFAKESSDALVEGKKFMNDIAESQLIKAIGEGKMTAIIYWLKNNHRDYADKIRYEHHHDHTHHLELDENEQKRIEEALHNIGLGNVLKWNGDKRTVEEWNKEQEKGKEEHKKQVRDLLDKKKLST